MSKKLLCFVSPYSIVLTLLVIVSNLAHADVTGAITGVVRDSGQAGPCGCEGHDLKLSNQRE